MAFTSSLARSVMRAQVVLGENSNNISTAVSNTLIPQTSGFCIKMVRTVLKGTLGS